MIHSDEKQRADSNRLRLLIIQGYQRIRLHGSWARCHAVWILLFLAGCYSAPPLSQQIEIRGETMGTTYTVKVVSEPEITVASGELKQQIDQRLQEINRLMSTWDPESEISRFNISTATQPFQISEETATVIREASRFYQSTRGLFDPTVEPLMKLWGFAGRQSTWRMPHELEIERILPKVGMNKLLLTEGNQLVRQTPGVQLDLSAIAKGYGVDCIASLISQQGYQDYMVEIGGEVSVRGLNRERKPWRLGIDYPDPLTPNGKILKILHLTDIALATSGDYRNFFEHEGVRYSHILNPHTGWPVPESVTSASVLADTCMRADAAATALMVLGATEGLNWISRQKGMEAFLVIREGDGSFKEQMTSGMKNYLLR